VKRASTSMRQISECLKFDETASSQVRKDSCASTDILAALYSGVERQENVSRCACRMSVQRAVAGHH
jgi:hypothetical protein